jgi:HEAT repeat protein
MAPSGLFKPNVEKMEKRRDVKGLTRALRNKDFLIRAEAARALGRIRDGRAVVPLIQALREEEHSDTLNIFARRRSRQVWEEARLALTAIGEPAVGPLIDSLEQGDARFRGWAEGALGRIREPAVGPLIQALAHESEFVRASAADALGLTRHARAVPPLIDALRSETVRVRQAAAGALSESQDPRVLQPLLQALEDADGTVRLSAALGLGKLGSAQAVEPLNRALHDPHEPVRTAAKDALDKLGVETHEKGIQTLVELCTRSDILGPAAYLDRAVEELKPHGAAASQAVGELVAELLQCRSPRITWALMAAERLPPTPELIQAVRAVRSAHGLVQRPSAARFAPEVSVGDQVGWTDGTEDGVTGFAARVLAKLTAADPS